MSKTYIAIYERDPYGFGWLARIQGFDECRSHRGTLPGTMESIRDEVARRLRMDAAEVIVEDRMPDGISAVVKRAARSRREADRAVARAQVETAAAARKLAELGVSRRDSAALLGLSHQRLQQLVAGRTSPRVGTPIGTPRGEMGADSG